VAVYAITGLLPFQSAGRRDTVLARAQQWLDTHPGLWDAWTLAASVAKDGSAAIAFELRFTSQADRDGMLADLVAFATGPRAPLAGSSLTPHTCTHDEPDPAPCVAGAPVTF
jgi:hypothetical protein